MPHSSSFAVRTTLWLAAALLAPAALAQTTAANPSVQDISVIAGTCAAMALMANPRA